MTTGNQQAQYIQAVKTIELDDVRRYVNVGKSSVIGSRKDQQDCIYSDTYYDYLERNKMISVLCDGMGGLAGGSAASSGCAQIVVTDFYQQGKIEDVTAFYKRGITKADKAIKAFKDNNGRPMQAGTTFVSAMILGNKLYWSSVGDSHIYFLRGNQIRRVNQEHNYRMILEKRVRNGEITSEQAMKDPQKDALISYVGMGGVKLIDSIQQPIQLEDGDYIVLCSDGLYRSVDINEVQKIVKQCGEDTQGAAEKLTACAMNKGKQNQDNTSVIVLQYKSKGETSV